MSSAAGHFDDLDHQRESSLLGMWIFLAAELLFFGGAILAFTEYRSAYPDDFARASNRTHLVLGTLNTVVLLTSSLTMALAVQGGRRLRVAGFLGLTLLLGLVFLGIKAYEWRAEFVERLFPGPAFQIEGADRRHAEQFFLFYFVMTGIHALHLLIGIGLLAVLIVRPVLPHVVEVGGLYWHFVDVVWIFLYPLLYLAGRHHG